MTAKPVDLPRPKEDQSDKHADVYFKYHTLDVRAIVGDVTITHPFLGNGLDSAAWGEQVGGRLDKVSAAKDKLYYKFHVEQGYIFLPLAATTYGQLDPHSIRMIWFLCDCACRAYYERSGWEMTNSDGSLSQAFMRLRSRFQARYRARISMAVARGAARRGMIQGARKGRTRIRVANPIAANQNYGEHLPLSVTDNGGMSGWTPFDEGERIESDTHACG